MSEQGIEEAVTDTGVDNISLDCSSLDNKIASNKLLSPCDRRTRCWSKSGPAEHFAV